MYIVTGNIAAFSCAINFYLAACYCVKLDEGVVTVAAIIIMLLLLLYHTLIPFTSPSPHPLSPIKQCSRLSLLFLYSVAKLLLAGYVATPQGNATYAKVQII